MKKLLSCILAVAMMLTTLLPCSVSAADAVNEPGVYLKQPKGSVTCTLMSAIMMLRRRAYLEGNNNWSSITESAVKPIAWSGGLRNSFSYAGMTVEAGTFSGDASQKKSKLLSLLREHPEGVVIYMFGNGNYTHAVIATDYDAATDTVYCADSVHHLPKGRMPLMNAYLSGNTQDARIGNLRKYWYVKSGNCNLTVPAPQPEVHQHSYTYYHESAHPHEEYKKCGCGYKEYTGVKQTVSSCTSCHPLGYVSFTRVFDKTGKTATFYRNNVANADNYTVTLYRKSLNGNSYGKYDTYNMRAEELYVSNLDSGEYYGELTYKNSTTGQSNKISCDSFKIVDTYKITYHANGGSGAPSTGEKIQNSDFTLSSVVPKKTGHIFKGWATSKNATSAQYSAGGRYSKNTNVTLYAVWEPETYTITYDANGGKGEDLTNETVTYGNTIRMPNSILKDGAYLKGWATSASATEATYKLGVDYKIESNLTLYAVWGKTTWGGSVATSFAGGDGTEANPYQISNAAELAYLAKTVNSATSAPTYKYYILTDNINLGYEEWVPIGIYGTSNQYFKGSFDGNGYTISDLYITEENEGYVGLFGYARDSEIMNFMAMGTIEGITTQKDELYVGIISGKLVETDVTDITVSYSIISGNNGESMLMGMIAGESEEIYNCVVKECHINFGEVSNYSYGGMLAGYVTEKVSHCKVESTEDGLFSTNAKADRLFVGGIAAECSGAIEDCTVNAPYFCGNFRAKEVEALGGVVGNRGTVKRCSVNFTDASGKLTEGYGTSISVENTYESASSNIGGLVGGSGSISDCKYKGKSISLSTGTSGFVGGAIGYNKNGSLNRIFVDVDGALYADVGEAFVGGIVGYDYEAKGSGIGYVSVVNKIFSNARRNYLGAASGYIVGRGGSNFDKAYYDSKVDITSQAVTDGKAEINSIGSARTSAQIKRASFQTGMLGFTPYESIAHLAEDETAVWVIKDGQYPELYHNVLRDITISENIENGTVTVDRNQAVDDEVVNVTATPNENYVLNKIYVNGTEVVGKTFAVSGNSEVYATFSEKIPEYDVSVEKTENASGSLVNVDGMSLMSEEGVTEMKAEDGQEIRVDTNANTDYTVDAIYVNGEEIVGNSFILSADTEVTLDVTGTSTVQNAVTNDAEEVSDYFAVLSGSVSGATDGAAKYIRYWKVNEPETVYVTDVEEGDGEYSVTVMLENNTEYAYQMTENGEIKTFKTLMPPDGGADMEAPTTPPITSTTYKALTSTHKFSVEAEQSLESEILVVALYDTNNQMVAIKQIICDGDTSYSASFPKTYTFAYAKVYVWSSWEELVPLGGVEIVSID